MLTSLKTVSCISVNQAQTLVNNNLASLQTITFSYT